MRSGNAGAEFPQKRITVNLAPADLRKEGLGYGLPIAVGILIASGQLPAKCAEQAALVGEFALDAQLRHVHGALAGAAAVGRIGATRIVLPLIDAPEAALIDDLEVIGVGSLQDLLAYARGDRPLLPYNRAQVVVEESEPPWVLTDFSDIRGQEHVKRALEVAAMGGGTTC